MSRRLKTDKHQYANCICSFFVMVLLEDSMERLQAKWGECFEQPLTAETAQR